MSQSPETPAAGPRPLPVGPLSHPYLLLILAPLFWGGNIVAGKMAVGEISPFLLILFRWTGAVLLLTLIALPHVRRDWEKIKPGLPMLALYGVLGFASFNMLMYGAAHYTAAVNASIEQAAIPVFVLIANFLIFRVAARPMQIVGLVLTVIGVMWVATHGELRRLVDLDVNIGDGMVVLACLLYAGYSLTLKYRPDIHWLSFMFVTAASAFVTSMIFQLLIGGGLPQLVADIPDVTAIGWVCVLYVMLFPSIIAQLCYARGVSIVGPNRASIFINLLPVFGTILSVIILREGFELYHLVASVLVIAGIVLAEYAVRTPAAAPK
mgnify:CR=1 FL=1